MIDAFSQQPIRVSTDGTAGPYLVVPASQLSAVKLLLASNGIRPAIDPDGVRADGRANHAVLDLSTDDADKVQQLLDSVDDDKLSVAVRLQEYSDEINRLMSSIERLPLSSAAKVDAQNAMKALKDRLHRDYKAGSTNKGQAAMSQAESAYFHPAIHRADCDIMVRWNSIPDEKWQSQLYACRGSIDFFLNQLISQLAQ